MPYNEFLNLKLIFSFHVTYKESTLQWQETWFDPLGWDDPPGGRER